MALRKKTCYTVECDTPGCYNNLEAYIGALDGLTTKSSTAEELAKQEGFIQISARKWMCPECARKVTK